jgi:hypothetical protein
MGKLTHLPVALTRLSKPDLKKWFDKKFPNENLEEHYKKMQLLKDPKWKEK